MDAGRSADRCCDSRYVFLCIDFSVHMRVRNNVCLLLWYITRRYCHASGLVVFSMRIRTSVKTGLYGVSNLFAYDTHTHTHTQIVFLYVCLYLCLCIRMCAHVSLAYE